jgi:hypothetical protein
MFSSLENNAYFKCLIVSIEGKRKQYNNAYFLNAQLYSIYLKKNNTWPPRAGILQFLAQEAHCKHDFKKILFETFVL